MAREEKTISELTNLSTVDRDNDLIMVVDVSDTSQSAQGTTKKTLVSQFVGDPGQDGADGADGKEVEIQNSGTYIQWRYVGDVAWNNLVAIADITGADGTNGTNGTDGREVQLQKGTTHIQWKYDDEVTWTDLIAVSELVGATGAPGSDGEDAYVYIAYASDASGTGFTTTFNADLDYIAIKSTNTEIVTPQASDFTGLWKNYKGAQGIQGIQGEQGLPGADGEDGASSYTYIAYASDNSGTGFTTTFDANLDYIAIKTTTSPIASPQASDFVGLWKNYKGEQGIQGEPGEDGLDITWRGVYAAETAYSVNDAVYYGGSSYICILPSTGNLPTNETYWNLMAQQGAAGEGSGDVTGPDGATDNAIARFDLSTGKIIQNSLVTVDDSGSINIPSGQQYLVNGSPVEGYSDEQAQDAVGGILTDSSEVDFTYDDTAPSITASLKSGSIDKTKLDISVNASLDLADSAIQPGDLATVATSGAYSDLTGKPTIPSTFDDLTDGTTNKAYTATEKTKLFGIAENANNYSHPNHSGDVTSVGDGATTIANGAVTNAKMANMATKTYKGRTAGTTGAPEDVPVATLKADLALVKGDVGLGNVDNTSDATKNSAVATLTNKTINADNNTISNLEVDNLKSGVLDTDLSSVSASDDTLPSAKAVKAYVDANTGGSYKLPSGTMFNGKIVPTVVSNNLTVALKTLAGGDPSSSDPVYFRIGDEVRTITSALSVTCNAGVNWCNAGSSELATKEIDYFVYLGYNTTDGVVIGFSRIPYAKKYNYFAVTPTNEKYAPISTTTSATPTDDYEVVGRFAATLSAGAGYTWSVPTFDNTNLIQKPIYTTRELSWQPTYSAGGSMTYSTVTTDRALYYIDGEKLVVYAYFYGTTGGTASNVLYATLPLTLDKTAQTSGLTRDGGTSGNNKPGFIEIASNTIRVYKIDFTNWGLGTNRLAQAYGLTAHLF